MQITVGMHFNFFTSSDLIGRNAEQYWLTERELEVDPTWAEHMCMGPIYCFHHLPLWTEPHLDPITIMKGAGFMFALKLGSDFTTSLEKQEASKYFLFHL